MKLWKLVSLQKYDYPYLKEVNKRGTRLLNILQPYLKPEDNFLDIMCGYSPLARPLLESGYSIAGFDNNAHVIKDLRRNYPRGRWIRSASFGNLNFRGFSVFLLLGVPDYVCCELSFVNFLTGLLKLNNPRLFFLEANKNYARVPTLGNPFVDEETTSRAVNLKSYNSVLQLLMDCNYEVLDVGQYDAGLKVASVRIYAILGNVKNHCNDR